MFAHIYFYAKAYVAALSTGVLYLSTVIGPDLTFADLGHVSLLHWIGFLCSVFGIGALTAVVTNGPAPTKDPKDTPQPGGLVNSPATAAQPANPTASLAAVFAAPPASAKTFPASLKVDPPADVPAQPAAPAVLEPPYTSATDPAAPVLPA